MSEVPFDIRPVALSDAGELLRLRRALSPDDVDAAKEIASYLASLPEGVIIVVAVMSRAELAGFIKMGLHDYAEDCEPDPVTYIEGWYVDPDLHGRVVGRDLVRARKDWTKARVLREMASNAPTRTRSL